ncbi:hypothetical protein [Arthrobacter sp. SAFR-014]|uniref:hypothetical protein n=1 Tax=Arthrobacter sp. SAFR-014 TaxID=3387280 RepID=UPI003F7C026C
MSPKIRESNVSITGAVKKTALATHSLPLRPLSGRVTNETNAAGNIVTAALGKASAPHTRLATPMPESSGGR